MDLARQGRNPSSADWQSAVSRIGNPLTLLNANTRRLPVGDTAGYQPALPQSVAASENLRRKTKFSQRVVQRNEGENELPAGERAVW